MISGMVVLWICQGDMKLKRPGFKPGLFLRFLLKCRIVQVGKPNAIFVLIAVFTAFYARAVG